MVGFVHGSCSSEASRRCSGLNKHVYFGFCLFLTGVRVVPEPTDTSTTIEWFCDMSRHVSQRYRGLFLPTVLIVGWYKNPIIMKCKGCVKFVCGLLNRKPSFLLKIHTSHRSFLTESQFYWISGISLDNAVYFDLTFCFCMVTFYGIL